MAHIKELPKDKQIDIVASEKGSDTIVVASKKLSNKITHKDNITSNQLSNKITHEDNITSNQLSNKITQEDNAKGNINEITTFDEKEYELNKSVQSYDLDDNAYDERWYNLQEFRGSEKEFVLTEKGYELKDNSKTWFYTKELGLGLARGVVKMTEGIGVLPLATLEKLNLISDGSVENFAKFYQENIYEKMGDTETWVGGLSEGLGQFIIPGMGAYGIFAKLIRAKGVFPFIYRALAAETVTVGLAQVPGDPNIASMFAQLFNVDTTKADSMAKEFYNYLASPDVEYGASYNADDVFAEKLRAIIGDMPMGPIGELLLPLFKMFAKGMRKLRGKKEIIEEIDKNIVKASDKEVFDIDNPPKGVIEKKMPQKGDLDYEEPVSGGLSKDRDAMDDWNKDIAEQVKMMKEKDLDLVSAKGDVEKMSLVKSNFVKFIKENPEGFTISIDGKITPNKGFVVAPIKNTEYRVSADTINMDDIDIFAQNIYALRQATNENINVYGGGWLDTKTNEYVLDAVHIIDNEADALYVAKSGNQDAIFDLGNFNEIRTDIGIKKLKESGAYESNKADEFRANKDKLVEGFEQTGSKSSSITKKDKDIITQEDIDEYGLDPIYLNTKITKSKKISKKLKKDFDEIIAGTKFHQELVVFKPNTPKKIQAEYYKIVDEPDKPQGDLYGEGIEESVIDENIRGTEIYNKYVDINKSEKKLEKFIVYVKENYPEKYFEKIMKRAGIDEDAYVDIGATSDNIITGKNNGKE